LILAAIDIGSNAARLLINEITYSDSGQPIFNKINLIRVPLRLGFDVFESKTVGKERLQMLVNTMVAFKHLMLAHKVDAIKACATSAMRDAENANEIIALVKQKAGIQIEVIDGDTEANMVYENHIAEYLDKDYSYLYIDVGGGSTEVSFFSNTVLVFKKSFNIGTIRLLKGLVNDSEWATLKETVKAITKGHKKVVAIGSGGNINKVFSLSKKKEGKVLDIEVLKVYLDEMQPLTIEQRMRKYNFREDRADVIVPALQIYLNIMRWAGADEISVPKIGLADGLIKHLYEEITKN
jgi:exopolyphosphatase / guanosine-5'-triphosphate,3'-diphosphate pyrophosphatase